MDMEEDVMSDIGKKKTDKKEEKKTFVFEIQLTKYTNDSYAEYNWKDLVQQELDKDKDSDIEIIEVDEDSQNNGNKPRPKPLDPEDEYDLHDDFIDDSEVNDENVPEDAMTAHGGFYINIGSLKFKVKDGENPKTGDLISMKRSSGSTWDVQVQYHNTYMIIHVFSPATIKLFQFENIIPSLKGQNLKLNVWIALSHFAEFP